MAFDKGHALVIGVGSHEFHEKYDVPITVRDAEAIYEILIDQHSCGYPETQTTFLHDEKATRDGIIKALEDLSDKAKEDDTVFIYFAGHGAFDSQKIKNYHLATHDVVFEESHGKNLVIQAGTGLDQATLAEKLKQIKVKRLLMIFNACHSGSLQPEALGEVVEGAEGQSLPTFTASALLSTGEGRIIISACKPDQLSSYFMASRLTWFTDALKDGLMGKAMPTRGPNEQPYISAFNLYNYVYEAVKKTAAQHDLSQDPMITVLQGVGPFPVALAGSSIHGLGTALPESLLKDGAVVEVTKAESARYLAKIETQNIIEGDYIEGDKIGQQYNIGGGAFFGPISVSKGDVIGRDQIINITQDTAAFAWSTETEEIYLRWVRDEFAGQIADQAAPAEENGRVEIEEPYEPLLSKRQIGAYRSLRAGRAERWESETGTWDALLASDSGSKNFNGLLIGDMHDGKSLLLMKIAHDLAQRALLSASEEKRELPIYMPISRFSFSKNSTADDLLAIAALISRQPPESFKRHWRDRDRKIALLIDDADLLPSDEQEAFVNALALLARDLRDSSPHSLLVACKPGVGEESLKRKLSAVLQANPQYTEWVFQPLDDARRKQLLAQYGAATWLRERIDEDPELRDLLKKPGMLFALVSATGNLSLVRPPKNMAQLYELLIDSYLSGEMQDYDYKRVKLPVLSYLAFRIVEVGRNGLLIDDVLYRDIVGQLEVLAQNYYRSRRVMPDDWIVHEWFKEIKDSPVIDRVSADGDYFEFASAIYRDFFAALYLRNAGENWREIGKRILDSGLEKWISVLLLLYDMLSGEPKAEDVHANRLLNHVLSARVRLATDLWMEKGIKTGVQVPEAVVRDYRDRRLAVSGRINETANPAIDYFRYIALDANSRTALQVVNGMMQLGMDAVAPLLNAVLSEYPIVVASALHALFHMGEFIALGEKRFNPLIVPAVEGNGFAFDNMGSCNATIGDLQLVSVPRLFRAELKATINSLDYDIFSVRPYFELWHTPVAWFAVNYFQKMGVDWIGLAVACHTVARCAREIAEKAAQQGGLGPVVNEMVQCSVSYDRLGSLIASDLNLPWEQAVTAKESREMQWLVENIIQVYWELRLLFSRANRSRMLNQGIDEPDDVEAQNINVSQTIKRLKGRVTGITEHSIDARSKEGEDMPSLTRVSTNQIIKTITGGSISGIHVKQVIPGRFLTAGALLCSDLTVGHSKDGEIRGIVIDLVERSEQARARLSDSWEGPLPTTTNGIRAQLSLTIDQFEASSLVGISAMVPEG